MYMYKINACYNTKTGMDSINVPDILILSYLVMTNQVSQLTQAISHFLQLSVFETEILLNVHSVSLNKAVGLNTSTSIARRIGNVMHE